LRRRVKQGFSFYDLDHDSVLAIWDDLWMESEWGDVLFAAMEYYQPVVRKRVDGTFHGTNPVCCLAVSGARCRENSRSEFSGRPRSGRVSHGTNAKGSLRPGRLVHGQVGVAGPEAEPVPSASEAPDAALGRYWPVMQRWIDRVDNWCHADGLSGMYSRLLAADPTTVMPVLERWNMDKALWPRRVSIVSLIHYTGKNAVFLPPDEVLPMVDRCVEDRRQPMQKAVGWVLREMWRAYPEVIEQYLKGNAARIAPSAFTRAIERMDPGARKEMRASATKAVA
ncbi:MAG: DNA alkylation repair protein, partial [Gammaproteobacteria bacterium]|nr:DNA alkylation repair protein [Gammaproteobacteria bacterium]